MSDRADQVRGVLVAFSLIIQSSSDPAFTRNRPLFWNRAFRL